MPPGWPTRGDSVSQEWGKGRAMGPHRPDWHWWITALPAMLLLVFAIVLFVCIAGLVLRWLGL